MMYYFNKTISKHFWRGYRFKVSRLKDKGLNTDEILTQPKEKVGCRF